MTSVQKRMEPRRSLLGASVEQTDARLVARFGPDDCVVCRGGNRARSSGVRPWDRSDQGSSLWFHGCVPNAESRLTGQSADPTGGGAGRMGNQVPVGPVTLLVGRDALEHRDQRGDEGTAVVRRQAQQGRGHVARLRFGSARCLVQVRSSVDAQEGRTIDVLARNMTLARRPS
ncbi:MAG: hypothetical protein WBC80_23950 [Isosphaeraceae bacterium]